MKSLIQTDEQALQNLVDRFNAIMNTAYTENAFIITPSRVAIEITVKPEQSSSIISSVHLTKLLNEFHHCFMTSEGLVLGDE